MNKLKEHLVKKLMFKTNNLMPKLLIQKDLNSKLHQYNFLKQVKQ
jgi:hypothetical protein